jgi:ubiquinone/menaquinone biosynthesis C-methylase UbiE
MLAGLSGRIVEVGAGHGLSFAHYPSDVTEVIAVEPEEHLRRMAEKAAGKAPVPVRVVPAVADELPGEDGEFDAAVTSLVLCSVPDQQRALRELQRVLRPGGELRFLEHVRGATRSFAGMQRTIDLVWPHVGGGCHLSRDTESAIRGAGFEIEHIERFDFVPSLMDAPGKPHIIGRARRP